MLKASVLFLSGLALVKLFSNDSAWKEVTELACTRELSDGDVRKIVALMSKCDPIPADEEEALKHPFVQFWMRLVSQRNSPVVRTNAQKLQNDSGFIHEIVRLTQNLSESQMTKLGT